MAERMDPKRSACVDGWGSLAPSTVRRLAADGVLVPVSPDAYRLAAEPDPPPPEPPREAVQLGFGF
jgi:hypothetical protein